MTSFAVPRSKRIMESASERPGLPWRVHAEERNIMNDEPAQEPDVAAFGPAREKSSTYL